MIFKDKLLFLPATIGNGTPQKKRTRVGPFAKGGGEGNW
jgi:hypothetical protein